MLREQQVNKRPFRRNAHARINAQGKISILNKRPGRLIGHLRYLTFPKFRAGSIFAHPEKNMFRAILIFAQLIGNIIFRILNYRASDGIV